MALLGLGLIAVSFCLFIYKIPPRRWIDYFASCAEDSRTLETRSLEKTLSSQNEQHEEQHNEKIPSMIMAEEEEANKSEQDSSTPKARSISMATNVPLFNLQAAEKDDRREPMQESKMQKPTTQSSSSQQSNRSLSSMAPPASKSSATSLMPPPTVKPSALRPLPKISGSLAPPPSAASSLRGLPQSSSPGLAIPPSTSTLPPNKRPSKKVLLDPGHSPLDWANLTRSPPSATFLRGANVPPQLIKVTPSQLNRQNGRKGMDAWGTYQGKVYNLTPYLKFHPGGVGELLRGAGKVGKAEELFIEIHPWVNWDGMLSECLVGILVSENSAGAASGQHDLEAMD